MKRNLTYATVAVASLTSSAVMAGNLSPAEQAPIVNAPVTAKTVVMSEWAGFYGGLAASAFDGVSDYSDPARGVGDVNENSNVGAFVGYNWQSGQLVYGGELHITSGFEGVTFSAPAAGDFADELGQIVDVRGRVGYAVNKALPYGFVGLSTSEYTIFSGNSWDLQGPVFGLGVDYLVTENIFAGIEVSRRDIEGDASSSFPDVDQWVTQDSITLRAGYKF